MTELHSLFFELIRVALGTQGTLSHTPSAEEWKELYQMAKKQSLLGICFAGVQKLAQNGESTKNLSETLYDRWMGISATIQMRNRVVNRQCKELNDELKLFGLNSCILKGQGVAKLYAKHLSNLRQSGDIDVWIDGSKKTILNIASKLGEIEDVTIHHAHVHIFNETEVETHFTPAVMTNMISNIKLQAFFEKQKPFCMEEHDDFNSASTSFNLIYLLVHSYHHFFTEGLGLRQLMDYYFVLHAANKEVSDAEKQSIKKTVKELKLKRFATAVMWLCNKVFGLPENMMIWEPNEEDGRFLLDKVMESGNFGKLTEDNLLSKPKILRPFYKMERNISCARFGYFEWFWGFASSIYWETQKS